MLINKRNDSRDYAEVGGKEKMNRHARVAHEPACPSDVGLSPSMRGPRSGRRATDHLPQNLDVLSADDLAQQLGCEPEHINALAAAHALPAIKIGRSWRFPANALSAFLNQQAVAHLAPQPSEEQGAANVRASTTRRIRPDLARTVKVA